MKTIDNNLNDGTLDTKRDKDIYLSGGCFWGTEHYFKQMDGVVETEVGFNHYCRRRPIL